MPQSASRQIESDIRTVRQFNRFYTRRIGLLEDRKLYAPFSLAECRILYELARREQVTASDLVRDLGLDPGYLSRMLRSFAKRGLIAKQTARRDARQSLLKLTHAGREVLASLEEISSRQVGDMLERLSSSERRCLTAAMATIESLLGDETAKAKPAPYLLRPYRPGDIGWVVRQHGMFYAETFGWNEKFEALVADIAAQFLKTFDLKRDCCWIAEMNGEPVGSVFVVKDSDDENVARLRLLIVDSRARGLGIGKRLVDEAVRFARSAGYGRISLWTSSQLTAARAIYSAAGFKLIRSEAHHDFGKDQVSETWEMSL